MHFHPPWRDIFFLREKKKNSGFQIFHIFYTKKPPFLDFWIPLIFGPKARKKKARFYFIFAFAALAAPRSTAPDRPRPSPALESGSTRQGPKLGYYEKRRVKKASPTGRTPLWSPLPTPYGARSIPPMWSADHSEVKIDHFG